MVTKLCYQGYGYYGYTPLPQTLSARQPLSTDPAHKAVASKDVQVKLSGCVKGLLTDSTVVVML